MTRSCCAKENFGNERVKNWRDTSLGKKAVLLLGFNEIRIRERIGLGVLRLLPLYVVWAFNWIFLFLVGTQLFFSSLEFFSNMKNQTTISIFLFTDQNISKFWIGNNILKDFDFNSKFRFFWIFPSISILKFQDSTSIKIGISTSVGLYWNLKSLHTSNSHYTTLNDLIWV